MFEILHKDLAGRIGKLYTKSGILETPAIFPVVNPAKQTLPLSEIRELGFKQIITNAYLVRKHYGETVSELTIHSVLSWDGVIMTDSGAYQLMEYGHVEVAPLEIVKYQVDIGSDIGVILDIPTRGDVPYSQVLIEVEETLRRARQALAVRDIVDPERKMLLVGPVQGGVYLDVVRYCARQLAKMDFDIYAIGSVTSLLENYEFRSIVEMIIAAKRELPLGKPVHLFGAGHPLIIPIAVALGIDLFDSASYVLYARDNRVILPDRTVRLEELRSDYIPCSCPVCRRYSVKELLEMPEHEREPLLAKHNLYVLKREIDEVKVRIREGTLWEYLQEKAHANPRVLEALTALEQYVDVLERLTPVTRGEVRGIFIYSYETDRLRPHYRIHIYKVVRNYEPPPGKDILLILPEYAHDRPSNRSTHFIAVCNKLLHEGLLDRVHICFFSPVFGIVPHEIADVYPLAQYEYARNIPTVANLGVNAAREYIKAHNRRYTAVILVLQRDQIEVLSRIIREVAPSLKILQLEIQDQVSIIRSLNAICSMVHLLSSSAPPQ